MPKYRHSKKFLQNHTVYFFNKKQLLFWVCMIVDEENVNFPNFDAFKLWCWRRPESPWDSKESKPINPKGDQSCGFIGGADVEAETAILLATWCKELTHLKRPWCWERLRAGGGGDDRGWDGWMASLTQWTWVWVDSMSWWWTGRPGVLWFMGSQRVRHNWVTELNWSTL